jgi:membrane associated rhomboid family serine protease
MHRVLILNLFPSLLPIGHERDSVRRPPVVTLAIIACCTVVLVLCQIVSAPSRAEKGAISQRVDALLQFWESHPTLEPSAWDEYLLDRLPGEQARRLLEFEPQTLPEGQEPDLQSQGHLEDLAGFVVEALPEDPRDSWGFSTEDPSPLTAVTHMFLHADWWHLLGNMLFLWICGVLLEDAWGRGVFLGLYLMAGLICVLPDLLRDDPVTSIGASGAIAGVMGAFAVRFWNVRLRVAVMMGILTRTVWVSSWVMLLLWLVTNIAGIADELNGETNTAHMAHVAGFAFGAAVALALRWTRLEERHLASAVEAKSSRLVHRNLPVERAFEDFDRELHPVGRKRLTMAVARDADDVDAAVALWDAAAEKPGATERDAMVKAIQAELRSGQIENATDHWRELAARFPDASLEFMTLLRLGEGLVGRGYLQEGAEAMAKALAAADPGTPCPLLLRLAWAAAEIEPRVCARAAGAVMVCEVASPAERAEARALLDRAEASSVPVSG